LTRGSCFWAQREVLSGGRTATGKVISSALVVGDAVYVVDCGDGVGKRYKQAELGPINTVSGMTGMENLRGIFLTHLHSDHTIDYFNLFLYGWYDGLTGVKQPVQIYGPGRRGQMEPIFNIPGQPASAPPPIVNPENPTPGTVDMTNYLYQAYALDINDRLRDAHRPDLRTLMQVHDIAIPPVMASEAPTRRRFPRWSHSWSTRTNASVSPPRWSITFQSGLRSRSALTRTMAL
jgi:Metal-dependent hydrolases of the beta-lactamase superfamily III